jgi:molybdopterin converting factor small subunit
VIKITCKYFSTLYTFTNKEEELFELADDTTVEGFLDNLIHKYGGRIASHVYAEGYINNTYYKTASVYLNKKRIQWVQDFPHGLQTKLKDNDIIILGLIMGGGSL